MSKDINFLRDRRKKVTKQEKDDRHFLWLSSAIFGGLLCIFLVVLGIHFYLNQQIQTVLVQEKQARDAIVSGQEVEKTFVVFVNKLVILAQLYQDRLDKKEAITYFSNIFGPSVFIRKITFDPQEKLLVFGVQSSDVFQLQNIFTIINSADTQQKFQSVTSSDLIRSSDGTYQMSVIVSTKKQ